MSILDHTAIAEPVAAFVTEQLQAGWVLPFHVAVIGPNGSFAAYTLSGAAGERLKTKLLWQHGDAMAFPINIFLVDSRGEAEAQVLLLDGGKLN